MSPFLLKRLSDELLGSRLANGEAAAFDELYRRYAHRLSAYAGHLLGDAAAGEDVAQSVLMKAYGVLRQGPPPEHVRAWLFRIAHNTAIDLVMRRRESPTETVPERAQPAERTSAGVLAAAFAALPDRQRDAYVLRELHGLRVDEIAGALSLTAPQVEQALFAARNRLAEHLTFGGRLDCVAVRRLLSGPLDGEERRALKPHLRSCPGCRSEAGLRGRVAGLFTPLGWLRSPLSGLAGGAPVAAKATAVVATATVAAAVPVATLDLRDTHAKPRTARRAAVAAVAAPRRAQRRPVVPVAPQAPVFRIAVPSTRVVEGEHHTSRAPTAHSRRSRDDGPDGSPAGEQSPPETATATTPTTTTTTAMSQVDGPGSGGGGDSPDGGGTDGSTAGSATLDGSTGNATTDGGGSDGGSSGS